MSEPSRCSQCGAELPAGTSADAPCPKCLLKLGLRSDGDTASPTDEAPPPGMAPVPDMIGPYVVLERIGEGGMGVVYLAEQREPIKRRVAIKVIKRGMDTEQVIARFETERQALALMNHPNIAHVFDAGSTEEGRPYFTMEYVPGIPITNYCDTHRLSTTHRLRLFVRVCEAIQHAHQKGIIHRDIKPSNVLVAEEGDKPTPKVIDFGVAKATSQRMTERRLFTEHGILIGSPEYMSPEQAEGSALGVDTRTDVYSLGVLLYELLVGVVPFEAAQLRRVAIGEMQRIICEDEPATPCKRLSSLGDAAREVAKRRRTDLSALARQIRGDLEWITLKALEKESDRRYPTADAFAADVYRHLRDEPVVARPPSRTYRLRKFMKRLGKLNPEQLMVVRFVNRMFGWFIWVVAAGQGVDTWTDEVCDERRNQASSRNHDANEAHRQ